jgi:hypothetical protein
MKDAKLAQKLGQLQHFIAVFPQECLGQLASFVPTKQLSRSQIYDTCQTNECCYFLSSAHPISLYELMKIAEKAHEPFSEEDVRYLLGRTSYLLGRTTISD